MCDKPVFTEPVTWLYAVTKQLHCFIALQHNKYIHCSQLFFSYVRTCHPVLEVAVYLVILYIDNSWNSIYLYKETYGHEWNIYQWLSIGFLVLVINSNLSKYSSTSFSHNSKCYYRLTCNAYLLVYLHTSTLLVYTSNFIKFTQPLYMSTIEPLIRLFHPI